MVALRLNVLERRVIETPLPQARKTAHYMAHLLTCVTCCLTAALKRLVAMILRTPLRRRFFACISFKRLIWFVPGVCMGWVVIAFGKGVYIVCKYVSPQSYTPNPIKQNQPQNNNQNKTEKRKTDQGSPRWRCPAATCVAAHRRGWRATWGPLSTSASPRLWPEMGCVFVVFWC